ELHVVAETARPGQSDAVWRSPMRISGKPDHSDAVPEANLLRGNGLAGVEFETHDQVRGGGDDLSIANRGEVLVLEVQYQAPAGILIQAAELGRSHGPAALISAIDLLHLPGEKEHTALSVHDSLNRRDLCFARPPDAATDLDRER